MNGMMESALVLSRIHNAERNSFLFRPGYLTEFARRSPALLGSTITPMNVLGCAWQSCVNVSIENRNFFPETTPHDTKLNHPKILSRSIRLMPPPNPAKVDWSHGSSLAAMVGRASGSSPSPPTLEGTRDFGRFWKILGKWYFTMLGYCSGFVLG